MPNAPPPSSLVKSQLPSLQKEHPPPPPATPTPHPHPRPMMRLVGREEGGARPRASD